MILYKSSTLHGFVLRWRQILSGFTFVYNCDLSIGCSVHLQIFTIETAGLFLSTFTNNYKLLTDPGNAFGSAHPGISKVYIHEHIPASKVEELSEEELMKLCFDVVNEPLLGVRN